jgi:hypothetical protein
VEFYEESLPEITEEEKWAVFNYCGDIREAIKNASLKGL